MPKEIAWYKSTKGRYGGNPKIITTYYALRDNGTFKVVDSTRNTVRVNLSFGSQPIREVVKCTKEDFHRELYKVIAK